MQSVHYAGLSHFSGASKEWRAVQELTTQIRKKRPKLYRDLQYGRHKSRTITINGKTYQVRGLNLNGTRIAYRRKRRR